MSACNNKGRMPDANVLIYARSEREFLSTKLFDPRANPIDILAIRLRIASYIHQSDTSFRGCINFNQFQYKIILMQNTNCRTATEPIPVTVHYIATCKEERKLRYTITLLRFNQNKWRFSKQNSLTYNYINPLKHGAS